MPGGEEEVEVGADVEDDGGGGRVGVVLDIDGGEGVTVRAEEVECVPEGRACRGGKMSDGQGSEEEDGMDLARRRRGRRRV